MSFKIKRVGHLVLKVKDLERSRKFFTEVMGFPQVGEGDEIRDPAGHVACTPDADDHRLPIPYISNSRRCGSSRHSLTRTRKLTASRPSTIR